MSKIIGIDLGTTNSVVAVMEGDQPTVIQNAEGSRITPSVVAFSKTGERLVGQVAKRQAVTNPENTIFSIKRFMGRRFDEVSEEMKMVPYASSAPRNGDVRIKAGEQDLAPPQISAMILQKLKQAAEDYLGQPVTKAVITVPAYFNDAQRQATKEAGQIAGLEVMRIVNEPTAAALAYGLDKKKDETIAVYDFGGGTFDISILEVGEGVVEVKSTNGDTHLGGDNLDQRIIEWIIDEFKKSDGIDLGKDRMALQRLREAAEKAKMELSTVMETEINLPFITADASGPKHLAMKLTRAKFESLVEDLLQKTVGPTKQALTDAGVDAVEDRRGGAGRRLDAHPARAGDRQGAVRQGTAQGRQSGRSRRDRRGDPGRRARRRSEGPAAARRDAAVARHRDAGRRDDAADPAQHHDSDAQERGVLDRADNQTSVEVHVLQGERPLARDNRTLGRFHLVGLPPAPRGVPQIEVTFDIDANGIVNVSAKDLGTQKEQKITITASSGLSKDEVDRMMREAESHADDDKKRREEIEIRNRADQAVYAAERMLKDTGDKTPDQPTRTPSRTAMADLKKAIEGNDTAGMSRAMEALMQAQHKAAEALYKNQAAARVRRVHRVRRVRRVRTVRRCAGAEGAQRPGGRRRRDRRRSGGRREEIADGP